MARTHQPTGIYRSILGEALRLTWQRKTLWVFGLFAGLISTGGVVDIALRSFQRASKQGALLERLFDQSFVGYTTFATYIQQLQLFGIHRVTWIVIAFTLLWMGVWVLGVHGQTALILNSKSPATHTPHKLRKDAFKHFWNVLTIDVLTILCSTILIALTTLPFLLYSLQTSDQNFWIVFIHTLIFLPLTIIVNTISMLALIDVVDHDTKPLDAIVTSTRLFTKQWIATFEFGLLLFVIVLILGLGLITLASLLMMPYALLYSWALMTGSLAIFFTTNILFGILFLLIVLAFAGAIVTFQYTAWHRFYKRAMHKQHGTKVFSKMLRWLK